MLKKDKLLDKSAKTSRTPFSFLNEFLSTQATLTEEERKSLIFNYFLGSILILTAIFALAEFISDVYSEYTLGNLAFLVILGLIWFAHRFYPKVTRHLFIFFLTVGAILSFDVNSLNEFMTTFSLPIIMAAFLTRAVYSFVYFLLITVVYTIKVYSSGFSFSDSQFSFTNLVVLAMLAMVAWLISQSLEKALSEARALNEELDQRVQDRTHELAEALKREQTTSARNTTILEAIADGIIVFDANQRVLMANPAANQLARKNIQSAYLGELLSTIDDEAGETLKRWFDHRPDDQSHVRFQWHKKTVSANVSPVVLPDNDGQYVDAGRVIALRDFTKEAELEKAKDIFFGMVSHELRTPMSAIKGSVEVLLDMEKDNGSEERREFLQAIHSSTVQLLSLANDLIDLSRIETGELDLYCQWEDILDIVQQAVKMVQQEFLLRHLSLDLQVEIPPIQLYIDRRRILQVVLNLLSNAYKYTQEGGATVRIYHTGQLVYISIADTGIGIKDKDQANLFTRFFRSTDQAVQKASGTGLGLSISKGFIELHGGQLTFESEYGVGTTFHIALPQEKPEHQPRITSLDLEHH